MWMVNEYNLILMNNMNDWKFVILNEIVILKLCWHDWSNGSKVHI